LLNIGKQKCPVKLRAVKTEAHFLFSPALDNLAAGTGQLRATRDIEGLVREN
jgi:hypothetical protein